MESKAKLFGHPAHQQLVALPLGMLALAVLFDAVGLFGGVQAAGELAFWAMGVGIVTGIVAVGVGVIDLVAIPHGTRAARVGMLHGLGNVIVLVLFVGSWALRRANGHEPTSFALVLSFSACALVLLTAWLGGELVTRLGIGVSDGAHANASSSLGGAVAADNPPPPETPDAQRRARPQGTS